MPRKIDICLLPDHCPAARLQGGIAVMVDVLRASTTILTALYHGARGGIPCLAGADARTLQVSDPTRLLGGERGGVKIDDFDLSNSPAEYDRVTVQDRTIVFTTTNGTRALLSCAAAEQVVIGAFVNVERLATYLADRPEPLSIVCAGTDGEVTGEDVLFAGCLIDRVLAFSQDHSGIELTDTSEMAYAWWKTESMTRPLTERLRSTRGGRNLVKLSFESDVDIAADRNRYPILAGFDPQSRLIVPVESAEISNHI